MGGEDVLRESASTLSKTVLDVDLPAARPTTSSVSEDVRSLTSEELDAVADFTPENLHKALGEEFSIEELLGALARLGDEAFQERSCCASDEAAPEAPKRTKVMAR